jgi:hypothetical protein
MFRRCLVVLALVALVSCGANTPTTPQSDWIELNALTPATGTVLTAGETVTFTATVTTTVVTSDGGSTGLLLQDQGNRSLQSRQPLATVPKGNSTVTLSDTITIPVSGSTVNLFMPLFVNGSSSTRAMKTATYPVK